MVLQLGDLVHNGDLDEPNSAPLTEWTRVDAAFDNLDGCAPAVPYLVVLGNHDLAEREYQNVSRGFNLYFGIHRFRDRGYGCDDSSPCSGAAGDWFIGGGDTIAQNSRNRLGAGGPGRVRDQPGRPACRAKK